MQRRRWFAGAGLAGASIVLLVGQPRADDGGAAPPPSAAAEARQLDEPGQLVGRYDGRWTWTDCAVPGEARAPVELDYVDGRWRVDLTAVHPGASAGDLVDTGPALTRLDAGVAITLIATGAGRLGATIALPSGCSGRAALTREPLAVAACADLAGHLRVHAACPKASVLVGDPAALLTDASAEAKGIGATCQRAPATQRRAHIDDACVPLPVAERPIDVPACQALLAVAGAARACAAMPPAAREALAGVAYAVGAVRVPAGSSASVVAVTAARCDAATTRVRASLAQARC